MATTTCPRCAFEIAGAASECPRCGVLFEKLKAAAEWQDEPADSRSGAAQPFNARLVSFLTTDRQYRTYVRQDCVYLIRYAGQPVDWGVILRRQLGLLGLLISSFVAKNTQANVDKKIQELDRKGPEQTFADHRRNMRITPLHVLASTITPGGSFSAHGPHSGRWVLRVREAGKITLQFPTDRDRESAEAQLPALLGGLHRRVAK